jgi:hypothetical protein
MAENEDSSVRFPTLPIVCLWCPTRPRRCRGPRPVPGRQLLQSWVELGARQPGVAGAALLQPQAMVEIPCRDCATQARCCWGTPITRPGDGRNPLQGLCGRGSFVLGDADIHSRRWCKSPAGIVWAGVVRVWGTPISRPGDGRNPLQGSSAGARSRLPTPMFPAGCGPGGSRATIGCGVPPC